MVSDVIFTRPRQPKAQRNTRKCSCVTRFQAFLYAHYEREKKPLELHWPVNKQQSSNSSCVVCSALYVEQKQAGKKVSYAKDICCTKRS
eukprot:3719375-Ditylum_brightwellii.AAC.1